jgi:hypothetical protein
MICMEIAAAREAPSRGRFVELARACGFELAGVAPALPLDEFAFYRQWVADGLAGPMGYLTDHRMEVRSDPRQLLASARNVLCLGKLYNTADTTAHAAVGQALEVGQASACAGLQPRKTCLGPAEAGPQTQVCPTTAVAAPFRVWLRSEWI